MYQEKQTIFIAEDHPEYVDLLKSVLEPKYKLRFSSNSNDLLSDVEDIQPDLILLDTGLPDIDCFQICSQLKSNPRTRFMSVLLMVNSACDLKLEYLNANGIDFVTNPVQDIILQMRVKTLLELKQLRAQVDCLVTTDEITGLSNRMCFEMVLNLEWRRALRYQTPQSVLILDIDFFDAYKGHYGQSVAEDCLRKIACLLLQNAKREIDCVARYGDHAFVILLSETDSSGALLVADQIQEGLVELDIPHPHSPVADHVTMSIGLATLRPKPKQEPAQLMDQASVRLSNAKRDGFNRINYSLGV